MKSVPIFYQSGRNVILYTANDTALDHDCFESCTKATPHYCLERPKTYHRLLKFVQTSIIYERTNYAMLLPRFNYMHKKTVRFQ